MNSDMIGNLLQIEELIENPQTYDRLMTNVKIVN